MPTVAAFTMTARDLRNQAEVIAVLLGIEDPSKLTGEYSISTNPGGVGPLLAARVAGQITDADLHQLRLALPLTMEQRAGRDLLPSQIRAKHRGRVLAELRAELEQLLDQTAAEDPARPGIEIALSMARRL